MKVRRSNALRRSSRVTLVQTLPTRPPLRRRLLHLLLKAGIVLACGLPIGVAIYAGWQAVPGNPEQVAKSDQAIQRIQLTSAQKHLLMARVY